MTLKKAREMEPGSEGVVKPQSWGGRNPEWRVKIEKVIGTDQEGNEAVLVEKRDGSAHSIGGGTIIQTPDQK